MARVPTLTREQVPEKDREAFDHETSGSGGVVESGPGSAMINNPEMRRRHKALENPTSRLVAPLMPLYQPPLNLPP
mgnify:CR=1 FL=1